MFFFTFFRKEYDFWCFFMKCLMGVLRDSWSCFCVFFFFLPFSLLSYSDDLVSQRLLMEKIPWFSIAENGPIVYIFLMTRMQIPAFSIPLCILRGW